MTFFYVSSSPEYNRFDLFPIVCGSKRTIFCKYTVCIIVSLGDKMKSGTSRKRSVHGRKKDYSISEWWKSIQKYRYHDITLKVNVKWHLSLWALLFPPPTPPPSFWWCHEIIRRGHGNIAWVDHDPQCNSGIWNSEISKYRV